jgi:hypothetical protein
LMYDNFSVHLQDTQVRVDFLYQRAFRRHNFDRSPF